MQYQTSGQLTAWNFYSQEAEGTSETMVLSPPVALSCIPQVNVSLNQQGFAVITPAMLVNAPDYPLNQYVVDIMGPLSNTVYCDNIGQELMAVVTELPTGNSCMSVLNVEDKLPPVFDCEADVLPCNTDIPSIDFEAYLEPVDDNCDDDLTLWYSFVSQNLPCNPDNYTKQVLVTWTATDDYGNSSTCVDTIFLLKPSLGQIDFPPDVSISCIDADTDPSNTGEPTYQGEPIDHACQYVSFHTDVIIPMCNPAYKIRRTWTVMDWCTGSTATDVQEILVVDDNKPNITCPPNVTLSTDFQVCTTKYTIPMPVVSDPCADADDIVVTATFAANPPIPGIYSPGQMVNLNLGTTLITMRATDPCGNTRICQYNVTVRDDLPPVIACPGDVTIQCAGITDPGATGFPIVIDVCDDDPVVTYEDATVSTDGCAFGYIITRTWMAEDESGNVATCMQMIELNDDMPPEISCPQDVTISCEDSTLPANTGMATASDECDQNPEVSYQDVTLEGTCPHEYIINRTWTATDDCGNAGTCLQVIYVDDDVPPLITCPPDMTIECTLPTPTDLATATDNCSIDVTLTYSDIMCINPVVGFNGPYDIGLWNTIIPAEGGSVDVMGDNEVMLTSPDGLPECAGSSVQFSITITSTGQIVFDWHYETQDVDGPSFDPFGYNLNGTFYQLSDNFGNDIQSGTATVAVTDGDVFALEQQSTDCVLGEGATVVVEFFACIEQMDEECTMLIIRTHTATDECDNVASCVQTLFFIDTLAPEIVCPVNLTIECTESTLPANTGSANATDDCDDTPDISYSDVTIASPDCAQEYTITRTWTAADACGNSSTCVQTIVVDDSTAPIISCPANTTIECTESTDPGNTGFASATDNCTLSPDIDFDDATTPGACPQEYTITRTWSATDACGNVSTCVQTITVDDSTAPVITCPANVTIECDESSAPGNTGSATAVDNCDTTPTVDFNDTTSPGACPQEYTITRTWTATDDCGNSSTCEQIIFVEDTTPPTITFCAANITIECDESTLPANTGTTTASDNCDPSPAVEFSDVTASGACPQGYMITRTWTATDACGNATNCIQIITVEDSTPPVITCPANVTIECDEDSDPGSTGTATAVDNCDDNPVITFSDATVPGACPDESTISRTWIATDACGNSSSCVQTIVVDDSTPPVITCPANTTIECTDSTDPANTGFATASDNCATAPIVDYSDVTTAGACPQAYIITRTWIATDNCGNTSTCNQLITVEDSTPPVITCPANVTIECDESSDPANTGLATAIDSCDDAPLVTFSDAVTPGGCPQEFTISRTWTATDACGNSSTCEQTIFVEDSTPPTITFCAANITIECDESTLPDNTGTTTATDNCDPAPDVAFSDATVSGQCPQGYEITRTWTATDACGNATNCIQIITVEDSTPPVITCPASVTIECDESSDPGNTGTATAVDNCDDAPLITFNDASEPGACPNESVISRTWTATDACGNSSTCIQTITVDDSTPPVITCPANTTIECTDSADPVNTGFASATDNCTTAPEVDFNDVTIAGACPQEYTIERTWTATDNCGNTSTCLQTITVDDSTPPVITCPGDVTISCTESTDPDDTGFATASDSCDDNPEITWVDTPVDGDCAGESSIERTWTATDACGNESTCVQNISIIDDAAPVISCPADITISCSESSLPDNTGEATATDNCDDTPEITFSDVTIGGDCPVLLTITRTWTATDDCGQSTTCVQIIIVTDEETPLITCPADITIECDESTEPDNTGFATATDECSPPVLTFEDAFEGSGCAQESFIFRTWTATDGCGHTSTCLQVISIVDTTPPAITCPPDVTVQCDDSTSPDDTGVATAVDNCDDEPIITFSDVTTGIGCPDGYEITRTWTATDRCGNVSTCEQIITIDDNIAPVVFCPGDVAIECLDSTSPDNTGEATASDVCDDAPDVAFSDVVIGSACPEVFTINRTWTATDNCGNSSTCLQVIEVEDNIAPICVPMDITIELNANNTYTLLADEVDGGSSDACGGPVTLSVSPNLFDCNTLGDNVVVLTVTDCSGNSSSCDATVTVHENDELIASCQNITIFLDENGNASIDPEDIDNGSGGGCDPGDLTFELDQSEFDCTPLGGIEVTLTVTDEEGNTATCTAIVTVQDTISPDITCPPNVTINCNDNTAPANTGTATASDNCPPATITFSNIVNLNDCGVGTIIRTFVATDGSGNSTSCTQTITVNNLTPFDEDAIEWPDAFVEVDICESTHPSNTGVPMFDPESLACANPDSSFVDVIEMDGDPETPCRVITRTWTVTDDCQPNVEFEFVQTIHVIDEVPPVFSNINDMEKVANDNCVAPFTLIASATDCAGVTITNDSEYGVNNGANASGDYPLGETIVIFTATDGCGNTATMDVVITVTEEVSTMMMCEKALIFLPQELEITLPADTFVTYSIGSCTDGDDFIISFSGTDPFDTLRTYDCGDVGVSTFSLWMWNLSGSMVVDSCETADLDLRDPLDYCMDGFAMHGTLESETGEDIKDVEVKIMNAPMVPDTSDQTGQYTIFGLNHGVGYGVAPYEDRDHRKGVSTLDLVKIQKHLLGKELLDSPYKLIAADANKSGSVTALDLLEIRKVILGINSKFPNNTSWRFVAREFDFDDPFNPFSQPFPEYIWVDSVTQDIDDADFIGLKVGDVNGSFFKSISQGEEIERRASTDYELEMVQEVNAETGLRQWVLRAMPDQGEISGMQFSVYVGGMTQREIIEINSELLSSDQIYYNPMTSTINVSWSLAAEVDIADRAVLIIPQYGGNLDIQTEDIDGLEPEAYALADSEIEIREVNLYVKGEPVATAGEYHLYQNIPNPFSESTSIRYSLPADEDVTLVIHDVAGRQVYRKQLRGNAGMNEIRVKKDEIGIAGIYYYTLYTLNASFTHKMSFTND